MARLYWLAHRYPTQHTTEARARAQALGHTLAPGRFTRSGLSYHAVCRACGLAAWIYPGFAWEESVRGYATTERCEDWRPGAQRGA